MKQVLFSTVLFLSLVACGQADKSKRPSPPAMAKETISSGAVISIDYSQPSLKGRTIGKDVEPMDGKVWRTGANETTEIKFYKDVTLGDKKITAGTYSLYTIPNTGEWTIIINSKLDTWGAYEYEESKDVVRFKVPAGKPEAEVEAFTIAFDGGKGDATMMLAWENTLVKIPVKF